MAIVWIPALLQDMTAGQQKIELPGENVRQLVDNLNIQFPGFKERLIEEGRLRPSLALVVDGEVSQVGLRHILNPESEVQFIPAISGGCS